jgi:hypothetical protein
MTHIPTVKSNLKLPEVPIAYHYCSTETFISIVSNKTIRLSDINTMNDFSERHWSYDQFIIAANNLISKVGRQFINDVDKVVHYGGRRHLPLVACLSADGDVLSQWRTYGDDSAGVAVGLDMVELTKLSVTSVVIEYDPSKQIAHFELKLLSAWETYRSLREDQKNNFVIKFGSDLHFDMNCFKNPAFAEEKEVRLIRLVAIKESDNSYSITDLGGTGDRVSRKSQKINFRSKTGGIVSYIDLPLSGLSKSLFKSVILGPKSPNNGNEISMLLTANGFQSCTVTKSKATLR